MTIAPMAVSPDHLLRLRYDEFVAEELNRLARRAPSLADDHLRAVEVSLRHIIDRLLPGPVTNPMALIALFDLEGAP